MIRWLILRLAVYATVAVVCAVAFLIVAALLPRHHHARPHAIPTFEQRWSEHA